MAALQAATREWCEVHALFDRCDFSDRNTDFGMALRTQKKCLPSRYCNWKLMLLSEVQAMDGFVLDDLRMWQINIGAMLREFDLAHHLVGRYRRDGRASTLVALREATEFLELVMEHHL